MTEHLIEDPSAAAEAERQRIVDGCTEHAWHGQRLTPWSLRLQRVLMRLEPHDVPLPDHIDDHNWQAWVPWSILILYLTANDRLTTWQPLLPQPAKLLLAAEEWGEQNVYEEEEAKAVFLAFKIVNEHLQLQPISRPGRREGRAAGESPSPSGTANTASSSPPASPA